METKESINDILSKRLKEARERRRLTIRELSEKTGFGISAISRYENGNVEKLPCDRLAIIANALNVSPIWLMGFDEPELNENEYVLNDVERFFVDTYRKSNGRQKAKIASLVNDIAEEIEKNNLRPNGESACG